MTAPSRDLQLLNTYYQRRRGPDPDFLVMVYRDIEKNKKKFSIISKPKFSFYITKEGIKVPNHLSYISKDDVEKVECYYSEKDKVIAQLAGKEKEFRELIARKQFKQLRKFDSLNFIFQSDMDIEDYYKSKWIDKYQCSRMKLTKGFYDIEVDSIMISGFPEPNEAKCPVNAITYIYNETKEVFTFLLRNSDNDQIAKVEKKKKKLIEEITEEYEGENLTFYMDFFDTELDLIKAFFDKVNETQPDICVAWNASFDIVTLENRITRLGGNKSDIICHKDFPDDIKNCYFVKDYRNQEFAEKGDYYQCTSYTMYMDQLIIYAALRKANGKLQSVSLQSIAEEEKIGTGKIDYTEISDIKNLPYDDYALFVKYNIRDVICQYLIEKKVEDFNQLFDLAYTTRTRMHKVLRKTTSLKNLFTTYCNKQYGLVLGNNINVFNNDKIDEVRNEDDDINEEQISDSLGGFVADPNKNNNNGIPLFNDKSKWIYENCIDEDATSMYPMIIRSNNIEASTQYGRYKIGNAEPDKNNDPGGDFIDCLQTDDLLSLGVKYLGLPSITQMIETVMDHEDN